MMICVATVGIVLMAMIARMMGMDMMALIVRFAARMCPARADNRNQPGENRAE